jgi:uncharacterized protein (TIGR03435 family)
VTLPGVLSPLANHLWQSTVFAVTAGLLTLALHKKQARTRYWIWLIGSLKFLVPFSIFIAVGSRINWPTPAATSGEPDIPAVVIDQVAQPFSAAIRSIPASSAASPASVVAVIPALVIALWCAGFAFVLLRWWTRWIRVRELARQAPVLTAGREVEALRRLEQTVGTPQPVTIVASKAAIEPSVFGIFKTVLVWPEGLSARLSDEELEAILLHEISHLRRHDNLTAALHMTIEALFWFHPLVWWLGSRLIDEREKACDEDVLGWGGGSQAYAEGILKVCEFCLESPLVCAAGVTGSDLKKRIEAIMIHRVAPRLGLGTALVLAAAAASALAGPVMIGVVHATIDRARSTRIAQIEPAPQPPSTVQPESAARVAETTPAPEAAAPDDRPATNSSATPAAAPETAVVQPAAAAPPPPPPPVVEPPAVFESASITPSAPSGRGGGQRGPAPAGGGRGRGGARGGGTGSSACTGGPIQIDGNRLVVTNKTLYSLITMAYRINCLNADTTGLVSGGPAWVRSDQFDVAAMLPENAESVSAQQFNTGEAPKLQTMLQNLLADGFKLTMHRETRELPAYVLTLGQGGSKLTPATETGNGVGISPRRILASKVSMPAFADILALILRRPVLDRTGISGEFNIDVTLPAADGSGQDLAPSVIAALEEQLGLKLQDTNASVEVVVIDQAEKPSQN